MASILKLRSAAAVALGVLGLLGALGNAFCGTALPSVQELPDMEGCITMGTRLHTLLRLLGRFDGL